MIIVIFLYKIYIKINLLKETLFIYYRYFTIFIVKVDFI
jgi:hypothetical protein